MQVSTSSDLIAALYQQNGSWLQSWVQRRVQNSEIAAELMQDTFVRLLARRVPAEQLQQPRAYLCTIAKGLVNDHWRRQVIEQAWLDTLAALPPQILPSEEDRLAVWQTLQELDAMLATLPEMARHVFLLSQIEGLTYKDIAQRLKISERTVKRYMERAFEVCLTVMLASQNPA